MFHLCSCWQRQLCSTHCTHVHRSCLCWASLASWSLGLSAFLQSKQVYPSSLLSSTSMFTCKHAATLQGKAKDMPAAASPGARRVLPTGCSVPFRSAGCVYPAAPAQQLRMHLLGSALTWITASSVCNSLPVSSPTCPLPPSTRW